MRRAMPYPCSGPIASSVWSTIKSSVPCRMSDLVSVTAGFLAPVGCLEESRSVHVGCQDERGYCAMGVGNWELGIGDWLPSRNSRKAEPGDSIRLSVDISSLNTFATSYAAAWCSHEP